MTFSKTQALVRWHRFNTARELSGRRPSRLSDFQVMFFVSQQLACPLWVISGHSRRNKPCPLYPESGHSSPGGPFLARRNPQARISCPTRTLKKAPRLPTSIPQAALGLGYHHLHASLKISRRRRVARAELRAEDRFTIAFQNLFQVRTGRTPDCDAVGGDRRHRIILAQRFRAADVQQGQIGCEVTADSGSGKAVRVIIGPAHDFLLPVPQAHVLAALRAVRIDAELFNPHDGAVGACWPSHLDLHRGEVRKATAHAAAPGTQQGQRSTACGPTLLKTFKAVLRWRCWGKNAGDI